MKQRNKLIAVKDTDHLIAVRASMEAGGYKQVDDFPHCHIEKAMRKRKLIITRKRFLVEFENIIVPSASVL